MAEAAKKYKLVTQMGTQIHAGDNYRRVVELIRSGAIGPVSEVHLWVHSQWAGKAPAEERPVPPGLHWDLWLGPAPSGPTARLTPRSWRGWWDFGGGTLADMACHYYGPGPVGAGPDGPGPGGGRGSAGGAVDRPTVADGPLRVPGDGRPPGLDAGTRAASRRNTCEPIDQQKWGDGVAVRRRQGDAAGVYGKHRLLPEEKFANFTPPPPSIPKSIGHYKEWVEACKGNGTTTCHFGYGGALTETVLLGNVAYRSGTAVAWDAKAMRIGNAPESEKFLRREYRKGWGQVVETA